MIDPLNPVRGQTAYGLRTPQFAADQPQTASDISALPDMAAAKRAALAQVLAGRGGGNDGPRVAPQARPGGSHAIDMGYGDEILGATGLLAPFPVGIATGLVNAGVRMNNLGYRDDVLQGLGAPDLSFGQRLGGVFGFNQYGEGHGLLNRQGVNIGGRNYGVSIAGGPAGMTQGGGVYGGRTTLTVDEAQRRAAIASGLARQGSGGGGRREAEARASAEANARKSRALGNPHTRDMGGNGGRGSVAGGRRDSDAGMGRGTGAGKY